MEPRTVSLGIDIDGAFEVPAPPSWDWLVVLGGEDPWVIKVLIDVFAPISCLQRRSRSSPGLSESAADCTTSRRRPTVPPLAAPASSPSDGIRVPGVRL